MRCLNVQLFCIPSFLWLCRLDQPAKVESWSFSSFQTRKQKRQRIQVSSSPFFMTVSTRKMLLSATSSASSLEEKVDDNDEDPKVIEIESLSSDQKIELIELSFFQACFALSKGNMEPLKLFIVAVRMLASQEKNCSATTIIRAVDNCPPTIRPLEPQEQELRTTWIQAIVLMLRHLGTLESDVDDVGIDSIRETYNPAILSDLVAIQKSGLGLNLQNFVAARKDILLPKSSILALDDAEDDPVQLAIVSQTIQVLFNTAVVVSEEEQEQTTTGVDKGKKSYKTLKKKSSGGKGFG